MMYCNNHFLIVIAVIISSINQIHSLLCYQCVSTHPGCGTPFRWIWYESISCPLEDDVCVKIIEKKGTNEVITRDCLSSVKAFRTDIPADKYEGCRAAAVDIKLANYVNNSLQNELDLKRNYYDSTTWCFCYFDHWCNGSTSSSINRALLILVVTVSYRFM